eukprot:4587152-Pyramimonas_sp.AAC.1
MSPNGQARLAWSGACSRGARGCHDLERSARSSQWSCRLDCRPISYARAKNDQIHHCHERSYCLRRISLPGRLMVRSNMMSWCWSPQPCAIQTRSEVSADSGEACVISPTRELSHPLGDGVAGLIRSLASSCRRKDRRKILINHSEGTA